MSAERLNAARLRAEQRAAKTHEGALVEAYELAISKIGRQTARAFTRLATPVDTLVADATLDSWKKVWAESGPLGAECERLYEEVAPLVARGAPVMPPPPRKWVPPPGPALYSAVARAGAVKGVRAEQEKILVDVNKHLGITFDIVAAPSQQLLDSLGVRAETAIGEALRQPVADVIAQSYAEGDTIVQTARAIRAKVANVKTWQAVMLARTDIIGISNGAAISQARILNASSDTPIITTKQWLATNDNRTRETHALAHGQEVPIDGDFHVGASIMDYPGDPKGPDGEVINCRCTLTFLERPTTRAHVASGGQVVPDAMLRGPGVRGPFFPVDMPHAGPLPTTTHTPLRWLEEFESTKILDKVTDALTADAVDHSDGSMVAVYPTEFQALRIARDGGQPADSLHVTLAFLPNGVDDEQMGQLLYSLDEVAQRTPLLSGQVSGHARFPDNGDGEPRIALPSVVGLDALRVAVCEALDRCGVEYAENYGWVPHMTLGYGDDVDDAIGEPLDFARLTLSRGPENYQLAFNQALTASTYIEAKHPRYARGAHEGGRWRRGGPVIDDAHVIPEIDEYANEGASWMTTEQLDHEKARLLDRYHAEYGPPLQAVTERLDDFPDVVIQPQLSMAILDSEDDGPSGYLEVTLKNGSREDPRVTVKPDGYGGLSLSDATPLDDQLAFQSITDVARFQKMQDSLLGAKVHAYGLAAAGFDPAKHPHEPGGSRIGGRWAKKVGGGTVYDQEEYDRILAKGDGPEPPPAAPPEKGATAEEILGDAENTDELYRDFDKYPETDGWPPERVALHDAIVDEILGDHQPATGKPVMVFLAGGSGAGKSTIGDPIAESLDAVTINPDDVKRSLPEYDEMWRAGDAYAAWGTHEESSYVSKLVLQEAEKRGLNIVVDGTGDTGEGKFLGKIRSAESNGYKTKVVLVDIPTDEAVSRANKRAHDPKSVSYGRVVPEGEIRRVHHSVTARHKEWGPVVDDWEVWDNTGATPKLVAKKGKSKVGGV